MTHRCPACPQTRAPGQYLCRGCWFALPVAARRALNLRDRRSMARLQELLAQVRAGRALGEVEVTP